MSDVREGDDGVSRCAWVGTDLEYARYHDEEWGRPLRGDRELFEKMCLEGFQAGLSWITILKRRPAFRDAFHNFDMHHVSALLASDVDALMLDARIIRNRAKIEATISNATVALSITQDSPGALDALVWSFAPAARPSRPSTLGEIPAVTAESTALSSELRRMGFRFVGPTTMYALMQSVGMVDDHVAGCWRAARPLRPSLRSHDEIDLAFRALGQVDAGRCSPREQRVDRVVVDARL